VFFANQLSGDFHRAMQPVCARSEFTERMRVLRTRQ
jgi:hypothetical protein